MGTCRSSKLESRPKAKKILAITRINNGENTVIVFNFDTVEKNGYLYIYIT